MLKNIKDIVVKKNGNLPEKVLQFGEGNFLRAFVDWMIDEANDEGLFNGSVVLCQPINMGMVNMINDQNGLYTLVMRGLENGVKTEKIKAITSISRGINPFEDYDSYIKLAESEDLKVIISNTTEAGIAYVEGDKKEDLLPKAFPAKIASFLYHRYKFFNGDKSKGILLLPVELIDDNGTELKRIVNQYAKEWNLEEEFIGWMEENCFFANTLVDRIVTGYPRDEAASYEERFGYEDKTMVTSEVFNLWVIEAPQHYSEMFPVAKTKANVIWTDNVKPYKKRKVRILNGGHTSTVLAAYLSGHDYVGQFIDDADFNGYLKDLLFEEIIPTIDLPKDELAEFADAVFERFGNPFIKHSLLAISLNSVSKFTARCLPSLVDYKELKGELPARLSFSIAALIKFYDIKQKEDGFYGVRENGDSYPVKDDQDIMEFFEKVWKNEDLSVVVKETLSNTNLWHQDLTKVEGLEERVLENLTSIVEKGVRATVNTL